MTIINKQEQETMTALAALDAELAVELGAIDAAWVEDRLPLIYKFIERYVAQGLAAPVIYDRFYRARQAHDGLVTAPRELARIESTIKYLVHLRDEGGPP